MVRCAGTARTPLGAFPFTIGCAPETVQWDEAVRRVVVRVAEPLELRGGGLLAMLAGGGLAQRQLLALVAARLPGATVAGDRLTLDLRAWPVVEAWATRPVLGHPACHFVQVRGVEAVAGALVVRLGSGLLGDSA